MFLEDERKPEYSHITPDLRIELQPRGITTCCATVLPSQIYYRSFYKIIKNK